MTTASKRNSVAKKIGERDFDASETHSAVSYYRMAYWSWGVSKKEMHNGNCLLYKVSGRLHKGWVAVTLSWKDLYDVHLIDRHGEITETVSDIFVDHLNEIMDNLIETPLTPKK